MFQMYLLEMKTADLLLAFLMHTTVLLVVIAQHNLTPFGLATQSSSYGGSFGKAEYAIYPPISNQYSSAVCTHTILDHSSTPAEWWMFQFSIGSAYITDITIYYREGLARRMDGFKLCVTNSSTIPPDSDSCYADPDPGFPNITQTISWNKLGKYVIYYDDTGSTEPYGRKDGPVVELCYVAINGCRKSFWGNNCETSCAENCIEGSCFPGNGSCIWGCNPVDCFNDYCNRHTAVCTLGCNKRKTGYHCNKYNLASDSLVLQNPSGSLVASLAIDGNKTSCSRTQGPTVSFQIDLIEKSIVTGILLTSREHITTGGNYSVYASNTSSSWKSGTVLYTGTSLPAEINFLSVFRYLTLQPPPQLPYASLEICEIGIVGCPPSYYGPVCTKLCPPKCHGPCDLDSGNCIFGCLNGWIGETCEQECSNGKFGTNCSKSCEGCLHHMCDSVDGLCDNTTICNPGYINGDYCNIACNNWYYGINCTTECNCLAEPCNKEVGICPLGGCKEGWHGESCNQKCDEGYFGRNCDRSCDGCISNNCDTTDGLCYITTGCVPGYLYDEYCNNTCDIWYFGNNCTMTCNCLTGPCSSITGMCPPGGCKNGWQGDSCDKVSAKIMESNSVLPKQVGLFFGGLLLGVLMTVAVSFLVQRKRQLQKTDGKENKTVNTQSHEQQQYDDVQHVQMENVSTYQDLMTPQSSNVYDQINTIYVNQ